MPIVQVRQAHRNARAGPIKDWVVGDQQKCRFRWQWPLLRGGGRRPVVTVVPFARRRRIGKRPMLGTLWRAGPPFQLVPQLARESDVRSNQRFTVWIGEEDSRVVALCIRDE